MKEEKDLPAQDNLPVWECRVETEPKDNSFTVGEVFTLTCSGDQKIDHKSVNYSVELGEKEAYKIKILKALRVSDNEASFEATSYRAEAHQFKQLKFLDDGKAVFKTAPLRLNVKSVQDPQNPVMKPFGPQGAITFSYPLWMWLGLIIAIVALAVWGIFSFRRRVQKKKVVEELRQHGTALGPYNQFNKDLRTLSRRHIFSKTQSWDGKEINSYMTNLDEIFRMYLLREFIVPALDWSSNLTLKEISKADRKNWPAYGVSLSKFLKELDRARNDINKVKMEDCQQLTQISRKVTQHIWQTRKRQSGIKGAR